MPPLLKKLLAFLRFHPCAKVGALEFVVEVIFELDSVPVENSSLLLGLRLEVEVGGHKLRQVLIA